MLPARVWGAGGECRVPGSPKFSPTHRHTHTYTHTPRTLTHFHPLLTTHPVSPHTDIHLYTHRHTQTHTDPSHRPHRHTCTHLYTNPSSIHALAHCILQVRNGKLQVWGLGFGRHLGSNSQHCQTRHQPTQKQRSQTPPPPSSQGRKLLSIKGPNL